MSDIYIKVCFIACTHTVPEKRKSITHQKANKLGQTQRRKAKMKVEAWQGIQLNFCVVGNFGESH